MKRIDMHTHTLASDGVLTAKELVLYAFHRGLGGISITDHDTVDGLEEGRNIAETLVGFWFLPGIEFSTEVGETEVHLLGYNIDESDNKLCDLLSTLKESRDVRAKKMVGKLKELGFSIEYEQVEALAGDGVVGRVHVARALVDHSHIRTVEEAFKNYLSHGKPAFVPRFKLKPIEVISLIHDLGGISVLAHPGLMKDDSLIQKMLDAGLMGIEAYYPTHTDAETQRYLRLAHKYSLLVTGGSDFHAPSTKGIKNSDVGQCSVLISTVQQFICSINIA